MELTGQEATDMTPERTHGAPSPRSTHEAVLESKRCQARRSDGEPCGCWAMQGQRVCRVHGGSSPQARAAAERRLAEAKAAQAAITFGLPIDDLGLARQVRDPRPTLEYDQ